MGDYRLLKKGSRVQVVNPRHITFGREATVEGVGTEKNMVHVTFSEVWQGFYDIDDLRILANYSSDAVPPYLCPDCGSNNFDSWDDDSPVECRDCGGFYHLKPMGTSPRQNAPIQQLLREYENEHCDFSDMEYVTKAALRYVDSMEDSQIRCLLYTMATHINNSID